MEPKIYEVGGCVRDELLGLKSKDVDYVFVLPDTTFFTVEQGFAIMTEYLQKEGFEIFLSTPEMFTIRAKFPAKHILSGTADFVLARKELSYDAESRHPKLVLGTLYDDLARRDFTMNAIAKDPFTGALIDPFNGQQDIKDRLIVCPLSPEKSFHDDPLRVLRAIRFMIVKEFELDDLTYQGMLKIQVWEKMNKVVSAERIREELHKMFKHNTSQSLSFLNTLNEDVIGYNTVFSILFPQDGLWLNPTFKK